MKQCGNNMYLNQNHDLRMEYNKTKVAIVKHYITIRNKWKQMCK